MSQESIRVGVIGAGANTRTKHIPNLQAIDGVEVVSVCNRSRDSSQRAADEFGIPQVYAHWWELIAAEDTNAIVIGTWPYMHHRLTIAALEAGKHVMCEARMAMNAAEAIAMRAAARARAPEEDVTALEEAVLKAHTRATKAARAAARAHSRVMDALQAVEELGVPPPPEDARDASPPHAGDIP